MKILPLILLLTFINSSLQAQDVLTTFILVRHAEKADDGTGDPGLSAEGAARARKFAALFTDTNITAVYSTKYKRTEMTVAPLAETKGVNVLPYAPTGVEAIDRMLADHAGETIVISGHSNTIPRITNHLLGRKEFSDFDESDYGNILIVTVARGSKAASVVRMRY